MNRLLLIVLTIVMLGCQPRPARPEPTYPLPNAHHLLHDFGNGLLAADAAALDAKLLAHEKQSGNEIAVVIIHDLGGVSVEEYAAKLFARWGIGKQQADNGLLLLWAINERKVRIEVGYGLEGRLTDGHAGTIWRTTMLPFFKSADYAKGLNAGVDQIISALMMTPPVSGIPPTVPVLSEFPWGLIWLVGAVGGLACWVTLALFKKRDRADSARVALQVEANKRKEQQTMAELLNRSNQRRAAGGTPPKKLVVDDDNYLRNLLAGSAIVASVPSAPERKRTTYEPSSSYNPPAHSSFDFGGGMSGGGGATGDY